VGYCDRMTTARQAPRSPQPAARRLNSPLDLSLVDAVHRHEPTYVRIAVEAGHYVSCTAEGCRRVLGVGASQQAAAREAGEIGTQVPDGGWRCPQHKGQ
jgi:hypothetical protein